MYQGLNSDNDINEKGTLINSLLALSEIHLQLVVDENWEEWERVYAQKIELYNKLLSDVNVIEKCEEEVVIKIEELEKETEKELKKRQNIIKTELIKHQQVKNINNKYKEIINKGTTSCHFRIKC